MNLKNIMRSLSTPLIVIGAAALVASIALLLAGHNPLSAFSAMLDNLSSADNLVTVVNYASRYYVMGVAVAFGFKMNLFNIGTNGQYQVAALFAGALGGWLRLPGPINLVLILIVAIGVGSIWAVIPGVLMVTRKVNIVVGTIMMNGIAAGLIGYLLRTNFRDVNDRLTAHTPTIPENSRIPQLNSVLKLIGIQLPDTTSLHGFLVIAVIMGIMFYVVVYRSRFGFDLLASGRNANAARVSGVNPKTMVIRTMALSGGLAGLAGMSVLLCQQFEYGDRFPLQLGFAGISVALLGRNSPIGIVFAATAMAAIEQGSRGLVTANIPQEIGQIVQGTLLVVAVIMYELANRRNQTRMIKESALALTIEKSAV